MKVLFYDSTSIILPIGYINEGNLTTNFDFKSSKINSLKQNEYIIFKKDLDYILNIDYYCKAEETFKLIDIFNKKETKEILFPLIDSILFINQIDSTSIVCKNITFSIKEKLKSINKFIILYDNLYQIKPIYIEKLKIEKEKQIYSDSPYIDIPEKLIIHYKTLCDLDFSKSKYLVPLAKVNLLSFRINKINKENYKISISFTKNPYSNNLLSLEKDYDIGLKQEEPALSNFYNYSLINIEQVNETILSYDITHQDSIDSTGNLEIKDNYLENNHIDYVEYIEEINHLDNYIVLEKEINFSINVKYE